MRENSAWFGKGGLCWRSSREEEKEDGNGVLTNCESKVGALFQLSLKKPNHWFIILNQIQLEWLCGYKHVNHKSNTADLAPTDVILQTAIGANYVYQTARKDKYRGLEFIHFRTTVNSSSPDRLARNIKWWTSLSLLLLTTLLLQEIMAWVFSLHISPLLQCRLVSLNLAAGLESVAVGINTSSSPWKSRTFSGWAWLSQGAPCIANKGTGKRFSHHVADFSKAGFHTNSTCPMLGKPKHFRAYFLI